MSFVNAIKHIVGVGLDHAYEFYLARARLKLPHADEVHIIDHVRLSVGVFNTGTAQRRLGIAPQELDEFYSWYAQNKGSLEAQKAYIDAFNRA